MKFGTHFLLILAICFFSFCAFAGKEEIEAEIASINSILELCGSNEDDSEETKKQAEECKQSYLLVLEQLQARLAAIEEFEEPEEIGEEPPIINVEELRERLRKAQNKVASFDRKYTDSLDRHHQRLEDDEEYTPNLYEDANELLAMRNLAEEKVKTLEQQIAALPPQNATAANAGPDHARPFNVGTKIDFSR